MKMRGSGKTTLSGVCSVPICWLMRRTAWSTMSNRAARTECARSDMWRLSLFIRLRHPWWLVIHRDAIISFAANVRSGGSNNRISARRTSRAREWNPRCVSNKEHVPLKGLGRRRKYSKHRSREIKNKHTFMCLATPKISFATPSRRAAPRRRCPREVRVSFTDCAEQRGYTCAVAATALCT